MPGQSALSGFRLERLLGELRQADDRISAIDARFSYFLKLDGPLSDDDWQTLNALLLSGDPVRDFAAGTRLVYTAPRPGTISPWSSKATDIIRACHLDHVVRVERGICYALALDGEPDDLPGDVGDRLFDRMTEFRFGQPSEAQVLFDIHSPAPVQTVRLGGAWVNSAGSGGSVVGLVADPDAIDSLRTTYEEIGAEFLELV